MKTSHAVKPARAISELEGAILAELHQRGRQTAFKVKSSFARSPSLEWRGSAGAVYAAIRRLQSAGLAASEQLEDRRGTRLISITAEGERALEAWAGDAERAVSVGVDPFRLRSGLWQGLEPARRALIFERLEQALTSDIENLLRHRLHGDLLETVSLELAIRLQRSRLEWLRDVRERFRAMKD